MTSNCEKLNSHHLAATSDYKVEIYGALAQIKIRLVPSTLTELKDHSRIFSTLIRFSLDSLMVLVQLVFQLWWYLLNHSHFRCVKVQPNYRIIFYPTMQIQFGFICQDFLLLLYFNIKHKKLRNPEIIQIMFL